MKAYRGRSGKAPLTLNSGTRQSRVVTSHSGRFTREERNSGKGKGKGQPRTGHEGPGGT